MLVDIKTAKPPLQTTPGCEDHSSAREADHSGTSSGDQQTVVDEPPPSYGSQVNASSNRTTMEKDRPIITSSAPDLREPPPEYVNPNRPQKKHPSHTCQKSASSGVPASVLLSIMGPPPEPETRSFWQRWRDSRQIARERRDDKTLRRTDMTSSRRWNVDGTPIHQRK